MCCHCRQLRRDLDKAREDLLLSTEVQSPHLLKDNFFKVDFYKPVVASKSVNSFSVGLRLISNFILGQETFWLIINRDFTKVNEIFF